jgi:hypothetical protein
MHHAMKKSSRIPLSWPLAMTAIVVFGAGGLLRAQEDDAPVPQPAEEQPAAEAEEAPAEPEDESYLDIEDDDFTPSEEVPADQSIAFPTDI